MTCCSQTSIRTCWPSHNCFERTSPWRTGPPDNDGEAAGRKLMYPCERVVRRAAIKKGRKRGWMHHLCLTSEHKTVITAFVREQPAVSNGDPTVRGCWKLIIFVCASTNTAVEMGKHIRRHQSAERLMGTCNQRTVDLLHACVWCWTCFTCEGTCLTPWLVSNSRRTTEESRFHTEAEMCCRLLCWTLICNKRIRSRCRFGRNFSPKLFSSLYQQKLWCSITGGQLDYGAKVHNRMILVHTDLRLFRLKTYCIFTTKKKKKKVSISR